MEYSDLYVRRIRQLCKERGIAINKLATMSGINQSTIDNIVRGLTKNPRVMTLHKIAIAFNMTVSEFLDFKELNDYSFDDQRVDDLTILSRVIGSFFMFCNCRMLPKERYLEITKSVFWDSIAYILRAWGKSESSYFITESTPEGGRRHETEAV